jgi:hypothetical protein
MPTTDRIAFQTRAGQKIEGRVLEDIGHALLLTVTNGRKNLVGRTMLFPKNDMGGLIVLPVEG